MRNYRGSAPPHRAKPGEPPRSETRCARLEAAGDIARPHPPSGSFSRIEPPRSETRCARLAAAGDIARPHPPSGSFSRIKLPSSSSLHSSILPSFHSSIPPSLHPSTLPSFHSSPQARHRRTADARMNKNRYSVKLSSFHSDKVAIVRALSTNRRMSRKGPDGSPRGSKPETLI